jgi:hypothetical protein
MGLNPGYLSKSFILSKNISCIKVSEIMSCEESILKLKLKINKYIFGAIIFEVKRSKVGNLDALQLILPLT